MINMSMTTITVFQLLGLFCAYLVITVLGPHLVIGKSLRVRNRYERFMLYTMFGNFYVMNVVYFLELCHISYTWTLILFTIVPCGFIKIKLEGIPFVERVSEIWETFRRLVGGQLKIKALWDAKRPIREKKRKKYKRIIKQVYVNNIVEVLAIIITVALILVIFGRNALEQYGYKASDVVVHNNWINELCENNIFSSGVYPYGYHVVVYYLHEVFGIDIYVILRLMFVVTATWVYLMLLCFFKTVCKFKYTPFLGTIFAFATGIFAPATYERLYYSIPQEYGMIFILPAVACAFGYFREQRREWHLSKSGKARWYLVFFALSFSMAFGTHFYGIMILGMFCIAIAIGYLGMLFRKPCFKRVLFTCLCCVLVAVLPMGVAIMGGKRVQGSLRWGMSIITGSISTNTEDVSIDIDENQEKQEELNETFSEKFDRLEQQIIDKGQTDYNNVWMKVATYIFAPEYKNIIWIMLALMPLTIILGIVLKLPVFDDRCYASSVISVGLSVVIITILLCATYFGLPALMDEWRTSVYYGYLMGMLVGVFADAVLSLVVLGKFKFGGNGLSLIALGLLLVFLMAGGAKKNYFVKGQESNQAIYCLTSIIKNDTDYKWTIVSSGDETRMVYGHGYHEEISDFIKSMEAFAPNTVTRIPTDRVYFFVEKRPISYNLVGYETEGMFVSEKGAAMSLPLSSGGATYIGNNRYVWMSKMYYWAERFRTLYPNEMTVFYEDDEFVCYKCEQNPYRLFNFAIDYKYNTEGYTIYGNIN